MKRLSKGTVSIAKYAKTEIKHYFAAIHIGCGFHSTLQETNLLTFMSNILEEAKKMFEGGLDAPKVAEYLLMNLEDDVRLNAGTGSNLTITGAVECESSMMLYTSKNRRYFGACGAVGTVKNPIQLSNLLIEQQRKDKFFEFGLASPMILVGKGAEDWAQNHGLIVVSNDSLKTPQMNSKWKKHLEKLKKAQKRNSKKETANNKNNNNKNNKKSGNGDWDSDFSDTVGCVCFDNYGNFVVATSSGGPLLKQSGRIGSSAMMGCGCFIETSDPENNEFECCMATCSGSGEKIISEMIASKVCKDVIKKRNLEQQLKEILDMDEENIYPLGIMSIHYVNPENVLFTCGYTTPSMGYGFVSSGQNKTIKIARMDNRSEEDICRYALAAHSINL